MSLKKIYSDDPLIKYTSTTIPPEHTFFSIQRHSPFSFKCGSGQDPTTKKEMRK